MLGKHAATIATGALLVAATALGLSIADHVVVREPAPRIITVVGTPLPTQSASASAAAKPTFGPAKPIISATHSGVLK